MIGTHQQFSLQYSTGNQIAVSRTDAKIPKFSVGGKYGSKQDTGYHRVLDTVQYIRVYSSTLYIRIYHRVWTVETVELMTVFDFTT